MKVIIKDKHTGYHEGAGAEDSVGISRDVGHTVADFILQRLTGAKTQLGGKLTRSCLEQYLFTGLFLAAAHSSKAGIPAGRIGLSASRLCGLFVRKQCVSGTNALKIVLLRAGYNCPGRPRGLPFH